MRCISGIHQWIPDQRGLQSKSNHSHHPTKILRMKRPSLKDATELLGVIAIVMSLMAVTYELRQTQSALIASTYQARATDATVELNFIADSEFLLPILIATDYGADTYAVASLTTEDRGRLFNWLRARMIDWDNEYYQYTKGYLTDDFFQTTTKPSVEKYASRWRALGIGESRSEFSDFVDSVLAEQAER